MPATYEPIATTTLGTAAATITFSSIPATYTDLRLVLVPKMTADANLELQYNSDTGTNYSNTYIYGDGSSALSSRSTSQSKIFATVDQLPSGQWTFLSFDVFSYAGSTNKTCLITHQADNNGSGFVGNLVGLWRNTAAITSLKLTAGSGNFDTGTTATLYGILKA
jgi:hypothetical protein